MTDTKYYAVPDPGDPGQMTYWRLNPPGKPHPFMGHFEPWPSKAKYGPRLLRKDVPKGWDRMGRLARDDFISDWRDNVRGPWEDKILVALVTDPAGCQARFAAFTSRCCICGRELTDPASKTYGIGPDCRNAMPAHLLADMAEQMGRIHAKHLETA